MGKRQQATTSTAQPAAQPQTPTCWEPGTLPGTDPKKQIPKKLCKTFTAQPAPAAMLAKQATYAQAVKVKLAAGTWDKLTDEQLVAAVRALMDSNSYNDSK